MNKNKNENENNTNIKFKFRIGNVVRIIDRRNLFTTYRNWFIEQDIQHLAKNWIYNNSNVNYFQKYKVIHKGVHGHTNEYDYGLYLVKNVETNKLYIIGEEGIELYSKEEKSSLKKQIFDIINHGGFGCRTEVVKVLMQKIIDKIDNIESKVNK